MYLTCCSNKTQIMCCRVACCVVQGVIAVDELLAPAYMVADGDDAPEEAEEYVEVENINPAQYYKV